MQIIKKTIEKSDCWDWAYVCATFDGKCSECPVHQNEKCAFCEYKTNGTMGEIIFETHLYFFDIEKDILIQHSKRICNEKWKEQHEKRN